MGSGWSVFILVLSFTRSRSPVDESWPEAREGKDRRKISAVGMDLEEPENARSIDAKHDPTAVGRIRASDGVDIPTLVMRYETKMCPVRADSGDVCRDSGDMNVSILRKDEVLSIGRPVLLDGDIETEGGDLKQITAVDAGGEEGRSAGLPIEGKKAKVLAVGGNIRVGAARADALPVVAVEIHAPERFVVCLRIESNEHDP